MTPIELCEPLFQYICRLNRSARKGGDHDMEQVRADLKGIIDDIMSKAQADPGLRNQFDYDREGRGHDSNKGQLYLILLFFADFMVRNSNLPFAMEWLDMAAEKGEQGGDEKFFELLDETLAQRSEAANQRLAVYYACMGLGFSGWYTGQPEYLRKKMLDCAARLRGLINADEAAKVCPEAYQHTNTADLVEPPTKGVAGIALTLVILVIALLVVNGYVYYDSSRSLSQSLQQIINGDSEAPTTTTAEAK